MNIYLVDSYSDDDPQFFTDIVPAMNEKDAEYRVLSARPYIMRYSPVARSIECELRNLRRAVRKLENLTIKKAQKEWEAQLNEEGEIE